MTLFALCLLFLEALVLRPCNASIGLKTLYSAMLWRALLILSCQSKLARPADVVCHVCDMEMISKLLIHVTSHHFVAQKLVLHQADRLSGYHWSRQIH